MELPELGPVNYGPLYHSECEKEIIFSELAVGSDCDHEKIIEVAPFCILLSFLFTSHILGLTKWPDLFILVIANTEYITLQGDVRLVGEGRDVKRKNLPLVHKYKIVKKSNKL